MIPFLITLICSQSLFAMMRWDEIRLSMTKITPNYVLESLYTLRIRESDPLKKAVLEL